MGFSDNKGKVDHYLNVIAGKVAESAKEDTPGAQKRTNKNDKVVYEVLHDGLENMIFQEAKIEKTDFGQQIRIVMESEGKTFQLSVGFNSRYGSSLLWKLPFIDVTAKFNISPYDFVADDGKQITGFSIVQNGEKIKSGFEEGKVPAPVEKEIAGEVKWDYSEREDFLYKNFINWAKNADPMAIPDPVETFEEESIKEKVIAKSKANAANLDFDDSSDLPF